MITLLSPSKSVKYTGAPTIPCTQPIFHQKTKQLVSLLATMSPDQLASTFRVSQSLAELNYERYQSWQSTKTHLAAWLFSGDVYNGLDADSLQPDDINYAQHAIAILSGLYGILRPTDAIRPYRLEMGTRLTVDKQTPHLYGFWGDAIAQYIAAEGHTEVLLCASTEYTKAVEPHIPNEITVVRPCFMQRHGDTLREKGLFAKYARGRMARWIIDNRYNSLERVKQYNIDDARYSPEHSDATTYTFILPDSFSLAGRFTKAQ